MKKIPNVVDINALRKNNLRPVVVGCFVQKDKILFVYKKEHDLWQLPQGGIENKETLEDAFKREMAEELGDEFVSKAGECQYIGQDKLAFPERLHGSRELLTDEGGKVLMKGKAYLFCKAEVEDDKFEVSESEFDDYKWVEISKAREFVINNIYQKGKQEITLGILSILT